MSAASAEGTGERPAALEDALADDEAVAMTWQATGVRWADQRGSDSGATTFVATDRRVVFAAEEGTTSIGYGHIRAVRTDTASGGPGVSTAIVGCGALCLLAGLVVATDDLSNGAGLVLLSIALLAAGSVASDDSRQATVTIVIGNERQRLTFGADESVGSRLAALLDQHR